jgi:hypothetical protein
MQRRGSGCESDEDHRCTAMDGDLEGSGRLQALRGFARNGQAATERNGRQMNDRTHAEPASLGDMLTAAGLFVGLLTAWLYMAGWNYAYTYFDHFRIPLLMIELPFEHYLMYGGSLVRKFPNWSVFIVLLLCVVGLLAHSRAFGKIGLTVIAVVLCLLLTELARWGGDAAARDDIRNLQKTDFGAFPRVHFIFDSKYDVQQKAIGDVSAADCGRLVASTRDKLFIVRPVKDAPTTSLSTIVISAKSAEMFVIKADYSSCK